MKFYTYGNPIRLKNNRYKNGTIFTSELKIWLVNSSQEVVFSFPLDVPDNCRLFETEQAAFDYIEHLAQTIDSKEDFRLSERRAIFTVEYEPNDAKDKWKNEEITINVTRYAAPSDHVIRNPSEYQTTKTVSVKYLDIPREHVKLIYGALKIPYSTYSDPEYKRTLLEYHYVSWKPNCTLI